MGDEFFSAVKNIINIAFLCPLYVVLKSGLDIYLRLQIGLYQLLM